MDSSFDGLPGIVDEDRSEEERMADRISGFMKNLLKPPDEQ